MPPGQWWKDGPLIPAAPFVAWINRLPGTRCEQGALLGVSDRHVRRWARSLDGEGRPTTTYQRYPVENALARAGVAFTDLYPDLAEDVELEPDAWCSPCGETVTPILGVCPWCETFVREPLAVAA